jgi:hypothetical protein
MAGNGTHERALRLAISRPGDADLHLLPLALRIDLDLLHLLPENLLAVGVGCGGSAPQSGHSGGELANGGSFLAGEKAR